MKEERLLPVGTKVFDIRYGWGYIVDCDCRVRPVKVSFQANQFFIYYTIDGKYCVDDKSPGLSLTEYTLENGGFTPISEYWTKPKVGDWGYFWDFEKEGSIQHIILGKLLEIKDATHPYVSCSGLCWRHFSHDIPEHIKKQMQQ